MPESSGVRTWRPRPSSVAGLLVVAAGTTAFAAEVLRTAGRYGDSAASDRWSALALLVVPAVLVAGVVRLRVRLHPDRVEVRRLLTTRILPLDHIADVRSAPNGVVLTQVDGTVVVADAVRTSTLGLALGRRSRADEIAEAVLAAREARSGRSRTS